MTTLGTRIEAEERVPAGRPDARLLGLSCLVASDLMFLNAFPPQLAGAEASAGLPVGSPFHVTEMLAFLLGALACAMACLAASVALRRRGPADARASLPRLPLLVLGVAFSAVGLGFVWAHDGIALADQSWWYAVACGAPIGAGNTLAHVLWGRAYAGLAPRCCLAHAAVSYAAGITVSILAAALGTSAGIARPFVWTACQAAALALVAVVPAQDGEEGSRREAAPVAPVRDTALYLWMALGAQTVFSLLMGVYWGTYSLAIFHGPALEAGVAWLVALVVLAVALAGGRAARPVGFGALYRVAVPVGAVLIVSDPFLSLMGAGDMFVTSGVSWSACFTAFGVVTWVATAQAARAGGRAAEGLFALARALWALALAVGVALGTTLGSTDVKIILSVTIVAFLVAVFVVQFALSRHGGEGDAARTGPTRWTPGLPTSPRAAASRSARRRCSPTWRRAAARRS